jgi:predicted DNA-binding transcriptional regulator AlpA
MKLTQPAEPSSRKPGTISEIAARPPKPKPVPTPPQSLRTKEAARCLGISQATLWRWSKERADMPKARRLSSRCTVFDRAELLEWRDAQSAAVAA